MELLLDTHALLWAALEPAKLSPIARTTIENTDNAVFVSAISGFEITNKHRLGKLPGFEAVIEGYAQICERLQADELPISGRHARFAGSFEWQHRDPFDRMLAAQASCEGLVLVTADKAFDDLPWVKTLW